MVLDCLEHTSTSSDLSSGVSSSDSAVLDGASAHAGQPVEQLSLAPVRQMSSLPAPLVMRDWHRVSQDYYRLILNPATNLDGFSFIKVEDKLKTHRFPLGGPYVSHGGRSGWEGSYYDTDTMSGQVEPVFRRQDPEINFDWKKSSPSGQVPVNGFSVVWRGTLRVPETRCYSFVLLYNDEMRLVIDGETVASYRKAGRHQVKRRLEAGRDYQVEVHYVEHSGMAKAVLCWDYVAPEKLDDFCRNRRYEYNMCSYLDWIYHDEIFTCMSPVAGSMLCGQDPSELAGFDMIHALRNWYQPATGLFRHSIREPDGVIHSGIYGYWSNFYGLVMAALLPDDAFLQQAARTATSTFKTIARGCGVPEQPDFCNLGFDLRKNALGGRPEPMNRFGNAPFVAWMLYNNYLLNGDGESLDWCKVVIDWYQKHLGRYELTYMPAPLLGAKLNAMHGGEADMEQLLHGFFGYGDQPTMPWHVTSGATFGGIDCDGLDGAKWSNEPHAFHAFTMGSLLGPSWLLPVVRYDQRYAREIGVYALNCANSMRLLQGYQLPWENQDHKDWKDKWDPDYLLFYEALMPWEPSRKRLHRPYASGDPIKNGWGLPRVGPEQYLQAKDEWISKSCKNIALYMGNHVGFLGAVFGKTEHEAIVKWDCLKTDWFHGPAYPTYLYYNPYGDARMVLHRAPGPVRLYDTVQARFLPSTAQEFQLSLAPGQVAVVVETPATGKVSQRQRQLCVDDIVVDYQRQ